MHDFELALMPTRTRIKWMTGETNNGPRHHCVRDLRNADRKSGALESLRAVIKFRDSGGNYAGSLMSEFIESLISELEADAGA